MHRLVPLVFEGDLALGIGPQPGDLLGLAQLRGAVQDLVGVHYRGRHQLRRLAAGETEHHPLVARALPPLELLESLPYHALVDVGGLGVDGVQDRHRFVVDPVVGIGVADLVDDVPSNLLDVHIGFGGDLATDEHHARRGVALAGHVALRIVPKAGVQHRVRNLVAELVWVPLTHGF